MAKNKDIVYTEHGISQPRASFVSSIFSPFRALNFVRENKGLKRYFFIPFVINIILLSWIFYLACFVVYPEILEALPKSTGGDHSLVRIMIGFLIVIVKALLFFIIAIIIPLIYSITGNIVTAPFNDPLSARVEVLLTGVESNEKFSIGKIFSDIIRITINIVLLISLFVLFNLAIALLNFVPVIGNIAYSILGFLGATFFLGFQFFDFPLERRNMTFEQKLRIIWKHKSITMGLGIGFMLISLTPFLGFLGINLGAVAATQLFVTNIKPQIEGV